MLENAMSYLFPESVCYRGIGYREAGAVSTALGAVAAHARNQIRCTALVRVGGT